MVDHRKLERLVDEDAIDELFRLVTWDEAAQAWHRHSLWRRAVAAKDVDIAEHPDWWAKELWHSTMLWDTGEMVRSGLLALVVQAPDETALSFVGAGPLEDFVSTNEDDLRWLEEQAATSQRFRKALANVWCCLPPQVFDRLNARQEPLSFPREDLDPSVRNSIETLKRTLAAALDEFEFRDDTKTQAADEQRVRQMHATFGAALADLLEHVQQDEHEERDADHAVRGEERGVEASDVAGPNEHVLVEEERRNGGDADPIGKADVQPEADDDEQRDG